jgi:hypothetical protein
MRFCVNYKILNNITVKNKIPSVINRGDIRSVEKRLDIY